MMLELEAVIAALKAYRARLKADGKLLKAMAVARRSRLVRALRDIGGPFPFDTAQIAIRQRAPVEFVFEVAAVVISRCHHMTCRDVEGAAVDAQQAAAKEARKAEHVTQKRLAQALGVSQKRISVIESGDVDHIKVDTLKRYLEGIGGTLHVTASLPGGKELRLV